VRGGNPAHLPILNMAFAFCTRLSKNQNQNCVKIKGIPEETERNFPNPLSQLQLGNRFLGTWSLCTVPGQEISILSLPSPKSPQDSEKRNMSAMSYPGTWYLLLHDHCISTLHFGVSLGGMNGGTSQSTAQ